MLREQHLKCIKKNREKTLFRKQNKDSIIKIIKISNCIIIVAMIIVFCITVKTLYNDILSSNAISLGNVIIILGEVVFFICLCFRIQKGKLDKTERRMMNAICEAMKVDKFISLHKCLIRWIIRRSCQKNNIHQQINNEL